MPCLILTGHPCAGKTHVAQVFRERAASHPKIRQTIVINEESACPDQTKAACYADSQAEKFTRGALKASFDRSVGKNKNINASSTGGEQAKKDLIILDSTNYIKGFRYELHCLSKAAEESHCVVWVLNHNQEQSFAWNRQRDNGFTEKQMNELVQRYEPPDERNRWDRPLYRIHVGESAAEATASSRNAAMSVLDKSVYNMHQLSDALGNEQRTTHTAAPFVTNTDPIAAAVPKKPAKSAFKRAIKRPQETSTTPIATLGAVSPTPYPPTASAGAEPPVPASMERKQHVNAATATDTLPKQIALEEQVDKILDSFLNDVKPLQEGTSTRQQVASDANLLHAVDAITQQVCVAINTAQNKATGLHKLLVGVYAGEALFCHLDRRVPLVELRRLRRQYLQWVATHLPEDTSEQGIRKSFVAYMEAQRS